MTSGHCGVCGRQYSECICIPRTCAGCRQTADRCHCEGRVASDPRERELDRELGVERAAPIRGDLEGQGRAFADWFVDGKDATDSHRILVRLAWMEGVKSERARLAKLERVAEAARLMLDAPAGSVVRWRDVVQDAIRALDAPEGSAP